MAATAASLTATGAPKSGNPCDRFTPPYCWLSRVISRITDSVNCVALREPRSLDMRIRLPVSLFVEPSIILRRSQDALHVVLRLGIGNVIDELLAVGEAGPLGHPPLHRRRTRVVAGEREVHAAEVANQLGEMGG